MQLFCYANKNIVIRMYTVLTSGGGSQMWCTSGADCSAVAHVSQTPLPRPAQVQGAHTQCTNTNECHIQACTYVHVSAITLLEATFSLHVTVICPPSVCCDYQSIIVVFSAPIGWWIGAIIRRWSSLQQLKNPVSGHRQPNSHIVH